MKAAVYFGIHDVKVTDFPEPELKDNCVKIAVQYCGLCGTDIHKFNGQGGSRPVIPPVALGHEVSGIVVDLGDKVSKDIKIGDRVVVDPNWHCGHCYYCQNGLPHMCENARGVSKGFAEYVCPPQENVYKIPDSLSLKYACLAEPLSCCIHGMDQLNVKSGDTVMIIGFGAIGAFMLQLAKLSGASTIIVVEPIEKKKELALKLGANYFINSSKNVKQKLKDLKIKNVDKVMECVGLKSTIENALDYAEKCATVCLFGLGNPNNPPFFEQYSAFQKELTIKTSFVNPNCTQRAINLLASGQIDCESCISKVLTLEDIPEELLTKKYFNQGKVIVKIPQ